MKTPVHWQHKNVTAAILFPLGCLYAFATWLRIKLNKPQKVDVPVICVGNLTAGGSGKTPVSIALARLLKEKGKKPFFISRGYRGRLHNVRVNPEMHRPADVGDEPLLLAMEAPIIVNHKRFEGAQKAIEQGADIIIMDDGFQNPELYKDKSFLVIDGAFGMGNVWPIPAGPMREFLSQGIKRANAVILLGEDKTGILDKMINLPIFKGEVVPIKPVSDKPHAIAFAGIGRPQKFYQSLEECGVSLIKMVDFPDHHFYTDDELRKLINDAYELNADLFTTSKDMVKIPTKLRQHFKVLEIGIKWQDEEKLKQFLLS